MKEEVPKKEPEVKEEPIVNEDGSVEIKLESESQETVVQQKSAVQPDPDKSFRNKVYAQDRIISKLQRELEEFKASRVAPQEPVTRTVELDEIDKIAQNDWKAAVRKLAQTEAQEIVKQERLKISQESQVIEAQNIIDKNSEFVLAKHNELSNPDSEKSQMYQDILNSNPRWRTNPDGPLLVMYEMETKLRAKGYDIDTAPQANETERLTRAKINSLPSGKPSDTNKFVLTKEQKELCDDQNIPYDEYARMVRKVGGGKGVEIQ